MIPDTPFISFTADLTCLGHFVTQVNGRAYSVDNMPVLDVVTWVNDDDFELEMSGPYGTPMEDAIHNALWAEARSENNRSLLKEAFYRAVNSSGYSAESEHGMQLFGLE